MFVSRILNKENERIKFLTGECLADEEEKLYKELNELDCEIDLQLEDILSKSYCPKCLFKKHQEAYNCKKKNCKKHFHIKNVNNSSKKEKEDALKRNAKLEYLKKKKNYNFALNEEFEISKRLEGYHNHDLCEERMKETTDKNNFFKRKLAKCQTKYLISGVATLPIMIGLKANNNQLSGKCIVHRPADYVRENYCLHGRKVPKSPDLNIICPSIEKKKEKISSGNSSSDSEKSEYFAKSNNDIPETKFDVPSVFIDSSKPFHVKNLRGNSLTSNASIKSNHESFPHQCEEFDESSFMPSVNHDHVNTKYFSLLNKCGENHECKYSKEKYSKHNIRKSSKNNVFVPSSSQESFAAFDAAKYKKNCSKIFTKKL